MDRNHQVDYIEFGVTDMEKTKQFYSQVFGWTFTDYGPDYSSFEDGRLSGCFYLDKEHVPTKNPLVVIYASDLEGTYDRVKKHGGQIVREIFSFPGGRRFHFVDPGGNELAVWSE